MSDLEQFRAETRAWLEAIQKEWCSNMFFKCVRILEPDESRKIMKIVARGKTLGTRFVFRDKRWQPHH